MEYRSYYQIKRTMELRKCSFTCNEKLHVSQFVLTIRNVRKTKTVQNANTSKTGKTEINQTKLQ